MKKLSEITSLQQRIISAIILAPLVLGIVYAGGISFYILLTVAAFIMYWEWVRMTKSSEKKIIWWISGILYIVIPSISLGYIMHFGSNVMFVVLFFIWSVDIGAYFAGKTIGGPKIAPKISPNKTWAGLFGAMVASSILLIIATSNSDYFPDINIIYIIITSILLSVLAQTGDFFESWVKRKFNVKDSSNIIPGHGGLLDRLDGLLFISPAIAILLTLLAMHYAE